MNTHDVSRTAGLQVTRNINVKRAQQLNLRKALRIVIPESPIYLRTAIPQRRQTMTLQRVHPASNGVKDRHRSEAHGALCGRKSVDRVWNFAFEELGRININFDPAWMSGKKQNSQNSRILVATCLPSKITRLRLTVRICVPEYNKVYFDPKQLKRQEFSEDLIYPFLTTVCQ